MKTTTQVGVFLLELANPRPYLIEIGRTPLGGHLHVLVEQIDHETRDSYGGPGSDCAFIVELQRLRPPLQA
ncbi:MAG: hypothetical protein ACJ765_13430, partial [Chloroflexota bacterium]